MPYRITRPEGSERHFFCGFALKGSESIYIDLQEAANHFVLRGHWLAEEVDKVPDNYTPPASMLDKEGKTPEWMTDGLISVMKCPTLKVLLREEIIHIEEAPKGLWEVYGKPEEWTNPFFYGYDTRKLPFKIADYPTVQAFSQRGFLVRDTKTKRPLNIPNRDADLTGGIKVKPGRVLTSEDFESKD